MKFRFDIDKAIAASAYLIQKNHGRYDVLPLVKALYHANRNSLVQYGRSITGDRLIAMKSGPNVSETYDLINGSEHADRVHLKKWREFIVRNNNSVTLVSQPNTDLLSEREKRLLDDADQIIAGVKGRIDAWAHKFFPEWKDPHGSSETIDPKEILRIENKSEEEIADIEEEIAEVNWLRSIAK